MNPMPQIASNLALPRWPQVSASDLKTCSAGLKFLASGSHWRTASAPNKSITPRVTNDARQLPVAVVERPRQSFLPRWAWAGGLAMACAIFAFMILPAFQMAMKDGRMIHRELAQLPHHLRILMADEHGLHYLIADQN